MDNITYFHCNNIILEGDFNIFFNLTYEVRGGNLKLENKSVAKFIHIKESLGLCDILRVRNPKKKRYTFRQQHVTGFIQRRLDYFLVSNNLQESINKTDILTALSTDHSPIFFSSSKIYVYQEVKVYGNLTTLCELKNHLKVIYNRMSAEQITDEQLCWEYMKYEIRKFSICFSKDKAKKHVPTLLH